MLKEINKGRGVHGANIPLCPAESSSELLGSIKPCCNYFCSHLVVRIVLYVVIFIPICSHQQQPREQARRQNFEEILLSLKGFLHSHAHLVVCLVGLAESPGCVF